jgi:translation initiation factor 2B subunit (eIF-2B alpha/beta/delta family)/8-oxo-dGTP pyrophosphatase MutT (NUDIX family)
MTRESHVVAVFRRKDTMPTFASYWAGISGSIEQGEEPWQTAKRELQEETNLVPCSTDDAKDTEVSAAGSGPKCVLVQAGGLYLDVPFQENRKIRVYPFVVHLREPANQELLEMRGTEHDTFQFISLQALEELEPAVPGLATAFHHATAGAFLKRHVLPHAVWNWADDRANGAATLAKKALELARDHPGLSIGTMAILRPSMVPIVNVLRSLEQKIQHGQNVATAAQALLDSMEEEANLSIQLGVDYLLTTYFDALQRCPQGHGSMVSPPFTIATFSRSSTILKLIQRLLTTMNDQGTNESTIGLLRILCAKSTPGDEGILMAQDLTTLLGHVESTVSVEHVDDETLHQAIRDGTVNVVVVGSDCVMDDQIVNKVGTKALAETCHKSGTTTVLCCTDQFKYWDDQFPPPLEDIFECIPKSLIHHVAMHHQTN